MVYAGRYRVGHGRRPRRRDEPPQGGRRSAVLTRGAGVFSFQAEDGIRATSVTGVQTCALPISQPRGLRAALQLLFAAGSAPLVQQRLGPTRDSADAYITRWLDTRFAETDANDLMYQVDASRDYDPSTALDRITAPVLAITSADDFINPPELGLMERLIPRVKRARYVLIPTSERTRGHGTHTAAAVWKEYFGPFVAALERAQ